MIVSSDIRALLQSKKIESEERWVIVRVITEIMRVNVTFANIN